MHVIKKEAEEIASILLLTLRIVHVEESLEDSFGIDYSLSECCRRVELKALVNIFTHMNEFC